MSFSGLSLPDLPLAFIGVGGSEILVVVLLVLVLFGGDRMPELARGIAKAIRELRKVSSGVQDELRRALDEPPPKPRPPTPLAGTNPYQVPAPPPPIAATPTPPLPSPTLDAAPTASPPASTPPPAPPGAASAS